MKKEFPRLSSTVGAIVLSGLASGLQAQDLAKRADPVSVTAQVPPTIYVSPFKEYSSWTDVPVAPWKSVNDTVAQVGGWRVYAKEAGALPPAPGSASGTSAKGQAEMQTPSKGPHSGHRTQ